MFNPRVFQNSRVVGIGVLQVTPSGAAEEAPQFVPLKRSELRGEIAGPLASLSLTQVYGYTHEQCAKVLEAVYRFPLPGDAAVTGVTVRFGDVEIQSELKPRPQAESEYAQAKAEGKQAALVTRESPDVFTVQVAGIQPDQGITVRTSYVQLARAEGSGWSLRVPLTSAPRYVRSDELTSRHAHGQPLALLRDPGHRFSLDLTLSGAGSAASTTHALQVTPDGAGLRVRLQAGEVLPDRDCVLSWRPAQDEHGPHTQVFHHVDAASGEVYFLALVAPPKSAEATPAVPREVVLLVDHSGSMDGAKWEAADWAVKRFLSELGQGDAFALGLFHNDTRWFAPAPAQADPGTVERAVRFLEENRDSGGTELGVALEQALALPRTSGERARNILIITDAEVSDEGRILRLADAEAAQKVRRRISLLCIDAAPNSFLALQLAERGGGVARFLTSAPDEEDISTALDEVLADWAQPVLAGLRLEVDRPTVLAAGRQVQPAHTSGWAQADLGDLPAGRTVWLAGRVPKGQGQALRFRLASGSQEIAAGTLDLSQQATERPALKALFGAWRVLNLEFLMHSAYGQKDLDERLKRLGYDPNEALAEPGAQPRVYAENARRDAEKALRGLLTREALDYGLASSETAFIAVRKEKGQIVEGTVAIANALPTGWSEEFLSSQVLYSAPPIAPGPAPAQVAPFRRVAGSARYTGARSLRAGSPTHLPAFLRDAQPEGEGAPSAASGVVVFAGVPAFQGQEAVLFDSDRGEDGKRLPGAGTFSRIEVRFAGQVPKPGSLDAGLALLIFVDDLSAPRARVRLADLLRQGGQRPLNIARGAGQRLRIVLIDTAGAWAGNAPEIEVALSF